MGCGTSTLRAWTSHANAVVPLMQKLEESAPDPRINAEVEAAFIAATASAEVDGEPPREASSRASAEPIASVLNGAIQNTDEWALASNTRMAAAARDAVSAAHEAAGASAMGSPEAEAPHQGRVARCVHAELADDVPAAEFTPVVMFHSDATVAAAPKSPVPPLESGVLPLVLATAGPNKTLEPIKGLGRATLEPIVSLQKQRAPLPPLPALQEHAVPADQGVGTQHLSLSSEQPTAVRAPSKEVQPHAAQSLSVGTQPTPVSVPTRDEQQPGGPQKQEQACAVHDTTALNEQPVTFLAASDDQQADTTHCPSVYEQNSCTASDGEQPAAVCAAADDEPPHALRVSAKEEQPGTAPASVEQQLQAAGATADFRAAAPQSDDEGYDDASADVELEQCGLPDEDLAKSIDGDALPSGNRRGDAHADNSVMETTARASAADGDLSQRQAEPDGAEEDNASVDGQPLTHPDQPAIVHGASMAAFPTLTEGGSTAVFGIGATTELASAAATEAPAPAKTTAQVLVGSVRLHDGPLGKDLVDGTETYDKPQRAAEVGAVVDKDLAKGQVGVRGASAVHEEQGDAADDGGLASGDAEHEVVHRRRADQEEPPAEEELSAEEAVAARGTETAVTAVHIEGEPARAGAEAKVAAVGLYAMTDDEELEDGAVSVVDAPRATMAGDGEGGVGVAWDEALDEFDTDASAPADEAAVDGGDARISAEVEAAGRQSDPAEEPAEDAADYLAEELAEELVVNRAKTAEDDLDGGAAEEGPGEQAAAADEAPALEGEPPREESLHEESLRSEVKARPGGAAADEPPDTQPAPDGARDDCCENASPVELAEPEDGPDTKAEVNEAVGTFFGSAPAAGHSAGGEPVVGDCVTEDAATEHESAVETKPAVSGGLQESEQASGDAEDPAAPASDDGRECNREAGKVALEEDPAEAPQHEAGQEADVEAEVADPRNEALAEAEEQSVEVEEANAEEHESPDEEMAPVTEEATAEADRSFAEAPAAEQKHVADADAPVEEVINDD